jgi:hypothetical protein
MKLKVGLPPWLSEASWWQRTSKTPRRHWCSTEFLGMLPTLGQSLAAAPRTFVFGWLEKKKAKAWAKGRHLI